MFYTDTEYKEYELKAIKEFKLWCVDNSHKIPLPDQEICRFMHAHKFDNQKVFDAIIYKYKWQMENLPKNVTGNVTRLMEQGIIYISGRDKYYRPILHVEVQKLFNMNPPCTVEEVQTLAITLNNYYDDNLELPGHIENRIQIFDLNGLNVYYFPYKLVHGVLGLMSGQYK